MTSSLSVCRATCKATISSLILVAGLLSLGTAHAEDAESLLQKYKCNLCHERDASTAGPAYVEIAARYRGTRNAEAILTGVVKKGAPGGWPWHMPPNPQVSDADAKKMVRYILSLR